MKQVVLICTFIVFGRNLLAQTNSAVEIQAHGFKSQFLVCFEKGSFSSPEKNFYMSLGGPSIQVDDGIESIGLLIAPAMRMRMVEGYKPQFLPVLGFGLQYGYKRLSLTACQFYKAESGIWELTGGIGVRLK
jgi:hypothetical protein